jgi:hypothetical protein
MTLTGQMSAMAFTGSRYVDALVAGIQAERQGGHQPPSNKGRGVPHHGPGILDWKQVRREKRL